MPQIYEFNSAISDNNKEIATLNAMKVLLSNVDNKARILVNGLLCDIDSNDSIIGIIDAKINGLNVRNKEYVLEIKRLEKISQAFTK